VDGIGKRANAAQRSASIGPVRSVATWKWKPHDESRSDPLETLHEDLTFVHGDNHRNQV
jgi:hypothetical protein